MIPQLANHLWHSTIFTCVVALLTLMLRRNRAALRHRLWMTASVKFLVPFSLLIGIGREVGWRNVPPPEQPRIEVMEQISEPFAPQDLIPVIPAAQKPTNSLPAILFGVWLFGFAAHSLAWWRRWRRVRIALHAASPSSLNLPTKAMFGPAHLEPGVFGIFDPVLLLPKGITERLTPAQFDAIIAHELCHVRRRDNLTAAIHMVVEALFWFHPLVWWIERRLVEEREKACDEEVLRMAIDPRDYAEGIVNVCRLYLEAPLVCISGVTGGNLKRRVEAIMANRSASRLNFGRKLLLTAAGITAVAAPLTLGILTASHVRAQATTTTSVPKFDVAAIRPCENNDPLPGMRSGAIYATPNRLHVRCLSLSYLVQTAYVTFGNYGYAEVSGGPAWIHSDQFNIEAETTGNPSARTLQGPMLQTLLEDRFKLKIRREIREVSVYDLNVSKGGFKLQAMKEGSCVVLDILNVESNARADMKATLADISRSCDRGGILARENPRKAEFHGMTLDTVATFLSRPGSGLGRPVINKTGIKGMFDFEFEFSPEEVASPAGDEPTEPTGAASIFTAIEKAAGLRLDRAKGPGTFFVIEAAEKPTEVAGTVTPGIPAAPPLHASAPKFEAVSIHRCDDNAGGRSGPARTTPGRLTAECATLGGPFPGLISEAYGMFADGHRHAPTLSPPIEGGPPWIKSERYTILATAAGDPGEGKMAGPMLQRVLEDRFQLKLHHETREIPVYALTVGRNGPRLHAADGPPCAPAPGAPCLSGMKVQNRNLVLNLRGTLAQFAQVLDASLDRRILDKTGLTGTFDLHLEFGIDQTTPAFHAFADPAEPSGAASIFTAIQDQLGLKLEAARGPGDFLVIDRIERPSGN